MTYAKCVLRYATYIPYMPIYALIKIVFRVFQSSIELHVPSIKPLIAMASTNGRYGHLTGIHDDACV